MRGPGFSPAGDASLWHSGTVALPAGHLAYHRTGGSGPALVLSHGLTDNGLCWSRFASALAPDFDVVMIDARGHGASARITAGEHHHLAQDIARVIDTLGLTSPIVMGHSVGARATAEFASSNPACASKVILEDPPFLPLASPAETAARSEKFRSHVADLQSLSDAEIAAKGKALSPSWHADEFPAWVAGKRQVDRAAMPDYATPWQDAVARISVPTLLIYGESALGGIVTSAIADEAKRLNPLIKPVQIEGAGHNIRRENFDGFLVAIRAFLGDDRATMNNGEQTRGDT